MLFSQMTPPQSLVDAEIESRKCGKVGILLAKSHTIREDGSLGMKHIGQDFSRNEVFWLTPNDENADDNQDDFPELD
jgi:hypothetical protein